MAKIQTTDFQGAMILMSIEDYEAIIYKIITISGNAKAIAYDALHAAKNREFELAHEKIKQIDQELAGLHAQQMELIQRETKGGNNEFSVLLVHALDIMMDSMAVRDWVKELVELYEIVLNDKSKR